MSSLVDSIFGGTDDSAQKNQIRANERTQQFIEEQAGLARGDVSRLLPMAADSARAGYESAFDLMQRTAPYQVNAVRLGNINAQESLLSGLKQQRNAVLGDQVSDAGLKVARFGETSAAPFANAQMPGRQQMAQPQQQPVDYQMIIQQLLSGGR